MAITVGNNSTFNISTGAGNETENLPASLSEDDIVVTAGVCDLGLSSTWVNTAGWTSLYHHTGGITVYYDVWYKRMGATPDSTVNIDQQANRITTCVSQAYSGVDTTTAIDNSYSLSDGSSGMPNAGSHTTVTNGALRIIIGALDDDDVTGTAPSGYTNLVTNNTGVGDGSTGASIMLASKIAATAGAEDPAAFGGSGSDGWRAIHFALRPAATGETIEAAAGTFTLTGQELSIDIDISAGTNSFLLTGYDLTIGQTMTVGLDAGSFTWAGNDLIADINLAFALGTFALTGYDTTINVGEDVTLDAGSYSWTGLDFTLDLTIPADAGSFALTGHDLTLSAANNIALETDSFALTGYDITLQTSVPVALDAGSFALTGYGLTLDLSSQLAAGSFTLTGYDATINLMIGELVEADAGSFAWSGLDSTVNVDLISSLEAGQFTMTGLDIAVPFAGVQRISDTDILQKPVNVVLHGTQPVKDRYREFELRQPNIRITPVVTRGGVRNLGNTRPQSFTVKKGGK